MKILFALILGALFGLSNETLAGCDPCKCGLGNGIPPPPECHRRPLELETPAPTDPCIEAKEWRRSVCTFVQSNLKHIAWGYEHSLRDYTLAKQIAFADRMQFDDDVLFAASMLHDIGGFPPYEKPGVDHAVRSTEVIDLILADAGFPMDKSDAVKTAIRTHSYYDLNTPKTPEAILLHDADCLDFLGNVAVMRILAIVGHEPSVPNIRMAIGLLESLYKQAPKRIFSGAYASALSKVRALEMRQFLDRLTEETFLFGLP
ncbi:MAG: HD domain-containing protein [Proteobacteria bacterium]|nr:HD domain-containing protein [Pseudomonadota bacterium]